MPEIRDSAGECRDAEYLSGIIASPSLLGRTGCIDVILQKLCDIVYSANITN